MNTVKRKPKVWCDEDDSERQPGDYYVDCGGTWLLDPNGEYRGYNQLTEAERIQCFLLISEEHLENARAEIHKLKTAMHDIIEDQAHDCGCWRGAAEALGYDVSDPKAFWATYKRPTWFPKR